MKFKKSISFVLTLCMVLSLFATFVIPVAAEGTATIVPTTLNSYAWTADTEVLLSTMSDSSKTVVDALGGEWFQWWTHVVADWSEADGAFVVTATQTDVTDYTTTTLGEGRIVLSAWGSNVTESAVNLRALAVGDKLYLDGDFSALVDGTGAISGYTLSVNAPLAGGEDTEVPEELPEGATGLDYFGYTHTYINHVMYVDADMTLGELVTKYYGQSKDLNYFKVIVVNEDGTVAATYLTLGRPDGVKTDIAVTAGQVVLALSADSSNAGRHEIADTVNVGDIVTLYNVDFDAEPGELANAGFTVEAAAPEAPEAGVVVPEGVVLQSAPYGDVSVLTDGETAEGLFECFWGNQAYLVAIENKNTVSTPWDVVIVLKEETTFNTVTIYYWDEANSFIHMPETVAVTVNGETYEAIALTTDSKLADEAAGISGAGFVHAVEYALGEEVTANSFTVTSTAGAGVFNMMTEVAVSYVEATKAPFEDGDNVVITYPADNLAISAEEDVYNDKYRLAGTDVANGAVFTVEITDDGIYFICDGKYLTSGATGNNLTLEDEVSEYSLWVLEEAENGWYIKNVNAAYNGNAQYIEYYFAFTTYGFNASKADIYTFQFVVQEAPVTSKVVTDWNPTSYKESVGGATGAFVYDDAEVYANCGNYWWLHAAFAPSTDVEGGYEVVALRPSSGDTVPFLAIPENGFVWMAWSSAGDTPDSSGAYALAFLSELAVGDVVFFYGVDFANHTTEADASAEVWVDPNAPVNIALGKDYTLSGEENATYNAKLTDGNAYGAMTYDNRWFAFTSANTVDKVGTVVIDLGALYDITALQANLVNDTGAGVAVPEYAEFYVSEDGETWSEAIVLTVSDANQVAYWTEAENLEVSAQYVKFEIKIGNGAFAFLNEIEVYGKEAASAPALNEVDGGALPEHNSRDGSLSIAANTAITYTVAFEHGANFNLWSEDVTVLVNGEALEMGMLGYVATPAKGDTVTIVNAGAEAVEIYPSISAIIPGTMSSPIVLDELGDITANVTEDIVKAGGTVFYLYTAPANGTLTITMPEGNWTYAVNNLTAGVYGDTQWSDSEDSSATTSIDVSAGDEIQIIVGTYNPESMWDIPVGELTFNAAFEANVVVSQVVENFNHADWNTGINTYHAAYIFTDAEIYAGVGMTWWYHASFAPTANGGYVVVEVAAPGSDAATKNTLAIPEGGFVWVAWTSSEEGYGASSGAYAKAIMSGLKAGDIVLFNGLDIANCTTTADASATVLAPAADMDLIVSHNYNYNWHCYETQIITNTIADSEGNYLVKAGDAPFMAGNAADADILYIVENVGGAYLVTGIVGGKALVDVVIPDGGFLYYVTSNCTGYDAICHGELIGKYLILGDIDLNTSFAIDPEANPAYTMKAVSGFGKGDVNLNGVIDATDYAILRKLALNTLTAEDLGEVAYSVADVNGDGKVNARDYYLVKRAFLAEDNSILGWEVKEDEAE